jgi:hypothetical protein
MFLQDTPELLERRYDHCSHELLYGGCPVRRLHVVVIGLLLRFMLLATLEICVEFRCPIFHLSPPIAVDDGAGR